MNKIKGLREMKARKAKFGFKIDHFGLAHMRSVSDLLQFLHIGKYLHEATLNSPLGGTIEFTLYTDSELVAEIIRTNCL